MQKKKYVKKNKNESRRDILCRHKIGGTWEEINENAEKRKWITDLKKSGNMKRKLVKKVRTDKNRGKRP
jgi:hypothetical protein